MSCYHPLTGIDFGINPITGKRNIRILSKELKEMPKEYGKYSKVAIPCGQCIGCRLDYTRQWANRCMLELKDHDYDKCWFLTLTYNDEHLPPKYIDTETGELSEINSLSKDDLQKFMKRLRKNIYDRAVQNGLITAGSELPAELKCRYYACGEYGPLNMRPHYHMILYNVDLPDVQILRADKNNGYVYYNSEFIQRAWTDPKDRQPIGFISLTKVTMETCNYVARYILKKQKGYNSTVYEDKIFKPEFTLMSRRPGIGKDYYEKNKEKIYLTDSISISTPKSGYTFKPPRYFDKLFDLDEPERMQQIKDYRKELSKLSIENKLDQTSVGYSDMLLSEETDKLARTKVLRRKEVF